MFRHHTKQPDNQTKHKQFTHFRVAAEREREIPYDGGAKPGVIVLLEDRVRVRVRAGIFVSKKPPKICRRVAVLTTD